MGVWNCGGQNWCCGEKSCCDDKNNIFELAATVGPTSTVLSATPISSASTMSTSTTETTPTSQSNVPPDGLSTGAKAGIGAGVAAFVVVAVAIALLTLKLRKSNELKDSSSDELKPHKDVTQQEDYQRYIDPHEIYTEHGYGELGHRDPQELEAKSGNVY